MKKNELFKAIKVTKSFLCVGLDPDLSLVPRRFNTAVKLFDFLKAIIDSTAEFCVAFKLNLAFFESLGAPGYTLYEKVLAYIPQRHLVIADAKRGDIGNSSARYADAFFGRSGEASRVDALTVNPYMGKDSITPFLAHKDKWTIILALTSNAGASDFQLLKLAEGSAVYEKVLQESSTWGTPDQVMFVIGATRPDMLASVRKIVPDHFLLIPGVGAQGGSLHDVCRDGWTSFCGLLVNSGRSILYASSGSDFDLAAAREARSLQLEMESIIAQKSLH